MSHYTLIPYKSVTDTIGYCWKPEHYGKGYDAQVSPRIQYLDEYLVEIEAKTVIIEHEYVDRNFIDDYCGYYARSFRDYPKKCERLLLFKSIFSEDELKNAILDADGVELQGIKESFLGYIVLRPIPGAHLGRVCLATYPPENGKNRKFPLCKSYHAHFMGMTFTVKSIAFQEQDNIISACATSALWSAFHCIKGNEPADVPSPYNITNLAKQVFVETIPTNVIEKGLLPPQMSAVISSNGLLPLLAGYDSKSMLKALTRAYMNVGLPLILGVTLAYEDEEKARRNSVNPVIGNHAVTITGYRLADKLIPAAFSDNRPCSDPRNQEVEELYLLSSGIDKFYAHDDQIGPFASMDDRSEYWMRLETRWNYYKNKTEKVDATVDIILIPCFNKIRVRFPLVLNLISRCNVIFAPVWRFFHKKLIWDAKLYCVNDFKEAIANRELYAGLDDRLRLDILSESLPRYLWVVDSSIVENDVLEPIATFFFDATDMESSDYFILGIHHRQDSYDLYSGLFGEWSELEFETYINSQTKNKAVLTSIITSYRDNNTKKIRR